MTSRFFRDFELRRSRTDAMAFNSGVGSLLRRCWRGFSALRLRECGCTDFLYFGGSSVFAISHPFGSIKATVAGHWFRVGATSRTNSTFTGIRTSVDCLTDEDAILNVVPEVQSTTSHIKSPAPRPSPIIRAILSSPIEKDFVIGFASQWERYYLCHTLTHMTMVLPPTSEHKFLSPSSLLSWIGTPRLLICTTTTIYKSDSMAIWQSGWIVSGVIGIRFCGRCVSWQFSQRQHPQS